MTVLCVSGIFRFTVVCWFSEFQVVCDFWGWRRQEFCFLWFWMVIAFSGCFVGFECFVILFGFCLIGLSVDFGCFEVW